MANSKNFLSNLIWRFLERCGAELVTFIVSIVLARILDPTVYGTIALVTVIITILQVFVNSGLGSALIQKKDADDLDFSTVFYFNVVMCIVLYALLFFSAPLVAIFYDMPELTDIVRVLGFTLVVSGVQNVQQSYVSKKMLFKKFFFSTLGGTVFAAITGILMALNGFGVWALVGQHLVSVSVNTVILWFTVKWRPKSMFSFVRLKSLFSYGWKLLVASLINTLYNDIRQLIIAKQYSSADLAFYNKGKQFPNLLVTNLNTSIDSVLFPVMAEEQKNKDTVKSMTRRAIKTSSFILWPMMVGLAVCAEPLIRLLLTAKWSFCVPYLQVFCFVYTFYPIHTANLNAIKAMGRSDIFLKLEVIKKVVGVIALVISMWYGPFAMACSLLITTIIGGFINAFPNKKLLNYSFLEQIKDMLPAMILSVIMGAIVYLINFIKLNDFVTLIIQVPLGVVIYFALAKLFKMESFEYILNLLKRFLRKGNKAKEPIHEGQTEKQLQEKGE